MSFFYATRSPRHRAHEVYRFRSRESRSEWVRKLKGKSVRPQNPIVRYAVKENDWTWRGSAGNKYQIAYVGKYVVEQ